MAGSDRHFNQGFWLNSAAFSATLGALGVWLLTVGWSWLAASWSNTSGPNTRFEPDLVFLSHFKSAEYVLLLTAMLSGAAVGYTLRPVNQRVGRSHRFGGALSTRPRISTVLLRQYNTRKTTLDRRGGCIGSHGNHGNCSASGCSDADCSVRKVPAPPRSMHMSSMTRNADRPFRWQDPCHLTCDGASRSPAEQYTPQQLQCRMCTLSPMAYGDAPEHHGSALIMYVGSPTSELLVSGMLSGESVLFEGTNTGAAALARVLSASAGAGWLPDLILLDSSLPDMSSAELLSAIRSTHSQPELPVILLTDRSGEREAITSLAAGVSEFITRPLVKSELLARVNAQLSLKAAVKRAATARSRDELLAQMLPTHIIARLAAGQQYEPEMHEQISIIFVDIVSFTEICADWPIEQVVSMLDMLFCALDNLCDKCGSSSWRTSSPCPLGEPRPAWQLSLIHI